MLTEAQRTDKVRAPVIDDTDVANGRRFVADHGHDVRYVADWGCWMLWDGMRWVADKSGTLVEARAKDTADQMAAEAAAAVASAAKAVSDAADDDPTAGKTLKAAIRKLAHAKKVQDMRVLRRMLDAARSERAVNVQRGGDVFDKNPHLLNCKNGVVDLRAGTSRPHCRKDFITKLCPTEFRPNSVKDEYTAFLARVFHGRPAVAEYIRKLAGYVLTGETCDHSFHVFHGAGANGKSVLLNLWTAVLGEGEYAHTAAPELLVNSGGERHPTERVGLRGARLVVCAESGEDGQLDEAKLKALTSDDMVTARAMRQDFYQFTPTHKIVLATNHRPRVRGTDEGIWRRLRLVPFAVRFWTEADKLADPGGVIDGTFDDEFRADPGLLERLCTASAQAVLADMVDNAVTFYRNGRRLTPPTEVCSATAEYRTNEDVIGQFFNARVRPDDHGRVKAAALYTAFRVWWESEGHRPERVPGVAKFGREAARRFEPFKTHGVMVYRVRLTTPAGGGGED